MPFGDELNYIYTWGGGEGRQGAHKIIKIYLLRLYWGSEDYFPKIVN